MSLTLVRQQIVACRRCPRLRAYCARVARDRKPAHRHEVYWGKPVPGFGDPRAHLLILGLAPAAHGANRTGRVFTGDGSGDFLMTALHRTGFASRPTSRSADDGLVLTDAYITAAVRCAPPSNKPAVPEIAACRVHLEAELRELRRVAVVVALGRIAFDAYWGSAGRAGRPAGAPPVIPARRPLRPRGRADGDRLVSSEPSEHQHREADSGNARGRVPRSQADPWRGRPVAGRSTGRLTGD